MQKRLESIKEEKQARENRQPHEFYCIRGNYFFLSNVNHSSFFHLYTSKCFREESGQRGRHGLCSPIVPTRRKQCSRPMPKALLASRGEILGEAGLGLFSADN